MSDPRHAMVFQCDESKFWLNIVPTTDTLTGDDSPLASETFGPFLSVEQARNYADDNFQNTGFVIPLYKIVKE
jgi:hypothetical protein